MKYFIDTEFLEGKQDKRFIGFKYGETKPTIDLISIGIVCEDGREFYAISKDFNLYEAWNRYDSEEIINIDNGGLEAHIDTYKVREYWIRENVLKPIFLELFIKDNGLNKDACLEVHNKITIENKMTYVWLNRLINKYSKSNKQIAVEIVKFIALSSCDCDRNENDYKICKKHNIEFYAYYADYDWVAFCQLFGIMNDLPNGFPKYCINLKQTLDEKASVYDDRFMNSKESFECRLGYIKNKDSYPKQTNEHNALADARWNFELYKFLQNI